MRRPKNFDSTIKLRMATMLDLAALQNLCRDTIHNICLYDYSRAQKEVWITGVSNTERWIEALRTQWFLVAEIDKVIAGFASLAGGDYIDFLYVGKDFQRKGIATILLKEIEEKARSSGVSVLFSDVSITAEPFFSKHGYAIVEKRRSEMGGPGLVNYRMEKHL